ncbi:hypothetical protein B0H16DRAFT_1882812 [Mycena metata]|uniref:F-box domain-containing protein n=1 Tax=Mycena metata TaxID=1033252 RepID=A0AAD7JKJ6_9AGAR|nr:hypothetical protein B0H16DRAFT_1882812 [Mycena metata]
MSTGVTELNSFVESLIEGSKRKKTCIMSLPLELLVEIFLFTVNTPLNDEKPSRYNMSSHLYRGDPQAALRKFFRLSWVSGCWREIVWSTPRLLAETVIGINLGICTDLDATESWLTGSSPYCVSVCMIRACENADLEVVKRTRDLLLPTVSRWRNLDIDDLHFFLHLNLPPGAFTSLERLHVRAFSECCVPLVHAFASFPRLRSFNLRAGNTIPKLNLFQHLPWWQLTEIDIEDDSLGWCRAVLLQCTNLVYAKIATSSEWDLAPEAAETPMVVLPFLATFIVTFGRADYIVGLDAFLLPLCLPSLKVLDVEFDSHLDHWPEEAFSVFQSRSPKITELTLLYCPIRSDELVTLLRYAPALTTLTIHFGCSAGGFDDDFLESLTYDDADLAPLAPKLENLHFECPPDWFALDPLKLAIVSRWWADDHRLLPDGSSPRVSRFKSVRIDCTEAEAAWSSHLEAWMGMLVPGLDFKVT